MKICKVCKFFTGRRSHIPYTSLVGDEKPSTTAQMEVGQSKTEKLAQPQVLSTDIPLPSPFQEMKKLKKPKGGKLTSLGIISVGISLAGLVVLVEHGNSCPQSEKSSTQSSPFLPSRPQTV